METLQKLVPFSQELLLQWYQFTQDNLAYAVCLAVSVWLLTAIFYSIRIGFLKKRIARTLSAKNEVQASLDEAKLQLETAKQELSAANEQMHTAIQRAETESQRAVNIEQRLSASNKQLANSLANLVECFELNQHNLPAAESDNLLSEHESVIGRVSERFQNEQQAKTQLQLTYHTETAKLAEKEMLASSLQNRLDTQTQQLAKLELAVEQYEAAQRQLEIDKQQLAQEAKKRQAEVERLAELQKQTSPKNQQPSEHISKTAEIQFEPVQPIKQAETVEKTIEIKSTAIEPKPEPVKPELTATKAPESKPAVKKSQVADSGKLKGLFGRAMEKIAKMDEKMGGQKTVNVQHQQASVITETRIETPDIAQTTEPQLVAAVEKQQKSSGGMNEKLTGLFGGGKKTPAKQPEAAAKPASAPEETKPVPAKEDKSAVSGKKTPDPLSGLFGRFKSKK